MTQRLHDPMFSSFFLTDIGYFPNAQYHFRKRNKGCSQAILLYCVAGRGYYCLDGQKVVPLTAGQAVVIPPDTPHEYAAAQDAPWSIYWLHFGGTATQSLCAMLEAKQPITIGASHQEEILRWVHLSFEILKRPCQEEEYYAVCQYASSVVAMVNLAGKQTALALTHKGGRAVDEALSFMKHNLHRSLTLAEIAAAASFSASHLHTLFKASTGYAPMEYFIHMKMQAAGKELFFSNRTVKEVAAQYGIHDSCYFSRIFKKTIGISPLEYRNLSKG